MRTVDCRGLACPAPVLQTKEILENEHPALIEVVVDNEAAKQNVDRFLQSRSFETEARIEGTDFHIVGKGNGQVTLFESAPVEMPDAEKKKIMVMIATDKMGRGDDELGAKLMVNFIKTLKEMGDELWRLVFVNNGVKLTIDDSQSLSDLKALADSGIFILVCGTCLDHFNLLDRKQVGETTNMLDIVTAMQLADKVINL
jgi:selenium metabolism protein YedF